MEDQAARSLRHSPALEGRVPRVAFFEISSSRRIESETLADLDLRPASAKLSGYRVAFGILSERKKSPAKISPAEAFLRSAFEPVCPPCGQSDGLRYLTLS